MRAYLKWQLDLETEHGRDDIEAVFDWVDGECELTIEEIGGSPPDGDGVDLDDFLSALEDTGPDNDPDDFGQDSADDDASHASANPVGGMINALEAAVGGEADDGDSGNGSARNEKKEIKKASQTIRVDLEQRRPADQPGRRARHQPGDARRARQPGGLRPRVDSPAAPGRAAST